ncbi:MAG: hypothetical protein KDN20_15590 [Verrucomicrobiae bacterium]|nr:hypothetical protein [Verrucomicrobiae bacterium]
MTEALIEGYSARYLPSEKTLRVSLDWPVRVGRIISAVKLGDLALDRATIELVTGGAFRDTTIVRIPSKRPDQIALQRWDPRPDGMMSPACDHDGSASELFFHCMDEKGARSALRELRRLAQL